MTILTLCGEIKALFKYQDYLDDQRFENAETGLGDAPLRKRSGISLMVQSCSWLEGFSLPERVRRDLEVVERIHLEIWLVEGEAFEVECQRVGLGTFF